MKRLILLILSATHHGLSVMGQSSPSSSSQAFLLDATKPYVYLTVEAEGPRQPRGDDEPKVGIWLYLHNNCRLPIVIRTFGVPQGAKLHEIGVLDNVVANPESAVGDGSISYKLPQLAGMGGSALPGELGSASHGSSHSPNLQPSLMPHGYRYPVSSSITLSPGHSIYFSLPRDHVSKTWHVEVPFRFALKTSSRFRGPSSFISLYEDDLAVR